MEHRRYKSPFPKGVPLLERAIFWISRQDVPFCFDDFFIFFCWIGVLRHPTRSHAITFMVYEPRLGKSIDDLLLAYVCIGICNDSSGCKKLHIGKTETSIEVWISEEIIDGFIECISISICISICDYGMCDAVVIGPLCKVCNGGGGAGVCFSDKCNDSESIVFVLVVQRFQRWCF